MIDRTGNVYGRLLVVSLNHVDNRHAVHWNVRCVCGENRIVFASNLAYGKSKSCGCGNYRQGQRTHGKSTNASYGIWAGMLSRCKNKLRRGYRYYGGRGITVCDRWLDFENFLADMGERPEGMSIDRIDNDGNYEPGNCKWSTNYEQMNNRSNNIKLTYKGKTMNMAQWGVELGVSRAVMWERVKRKLPDDQLFHKGNMKLKVNKTSKYKRLYGINQKEMMAKFNTTIYALNNMSHSETMVMLSNLICRNWATWKAKK